jgi:hypothetical protein
VDAHAGQASRPLFRMSYTSVHAMMSLPCTRPSRL